MDIQILYVPRCFYLEVRDKHEHRNGYESAYGRTVPGTIRYVVCFEIGFLTQKTNPHFIFENWFTGHYNGSHYTGMVPSTCLFS